MSNEEIYKQELKRIEADYKSAKQAAAITYANNANPYKIGDTVTDHIGSLVIEKITYSKGFGNGMPHCVYHGIRIGKNGKPMKRENSPVYQTNIIK